MLILVLRRWVLPSVPVLHGLSLPTNFLNNNANNQLVVDCYTTMDKWLLLLLLSVLGARGQEAIGTDALATTAPGNESAKESVPPALRFPRGTVYQIRPVNIRDGDFSGFESIADFAKSVDQEPRPSELKVINVADSEALEAQLPNFLQAGANSDEEVHLRAAETKRYDNREDKREDKQGVREQRRYDHHSDHTHNPDDEPWDASYAFGFTLEDQARHEVSDADGNVKGYYQYVDDEGFVRKVVYTAGAGKGFVVLNKEKVRGPHPLPPKKKISHKVISSNKGNSGYEDDRDKQRPSYGGSSSSSRPRPYPESALSASLEDYPFPAKAPPTPLPQAPASFGWGSKSGGGGGGGGGGRRPIFVVKIRRPQDKHGREDEEEDEGDDNGAYNQDTRRYDSSENDGQWDGDVGNGPIYPFRRRVIKGQSHLDGGSSGERPDASYTFGYETDTANRLEKSDKLGNVRGSYSYIDSEGIKRTVHYIAGATTGFQVLGTSPSASRSVRIEAPPGFVVTRRHAKDSPAPKFTTAESEYPSYPTTVVYHIHPDSNSINLSPWDTFGLEKGTRRWVGPRRMRRIMRVHRKRPRTNYSRKEENEVEKEEVSTEPPPPPQETLLTPSVDTKPTRTLRFRTDSDYPRSFRHSTRVNLDNFDMKNYFVRRMRPSHRAYTQGLKDYQGEVEERYLQQEERDVERNDPILLGPGHQALSSRGPTPIPNPIVFQPSKNKVSVRNKGAPLEVAESNLYVMRDKGPTKSPVTDFTQTDTSREVSTSKSMQMSISSSTMRMPVSSSVVSNTSAPTTTPPTTTTEEEASSSPASEVMMSSSTRLMQRLGVNPPA